MIVRLRPMAIPMMVPPKRVCVRMGVGLTVIRIRTMMMIIILVLMTMITVLSMMTMMDVKMGWWGMMRMPTVVWRPPGTPGVLSCVNVSVHGKPNVKPKIKIRCLRYVHRPPIPPCVRAFPPILPSPPSLRTVLPCRPVSPTKSTTVPIKDGVPSVVSMDKLFKMVIRGNR